MYKRQVKLIKDDFRVLRSFDPRRASWSTWISIVARSTAIDVLRRRRLSTAPLSEDLAGSGPEPAESIETIDIPLQLLTPRQQLVLSLLFEDDKSVAEAAAFLNVNEQTIRSTKHKALERLRKHFESKEAGDDPAFDSVQPVVEHGTIDDG